MKARVVAECCGNHGGSFPTAVEMVQTAAECGVFAVKFQKRDPDTFPAMTWEHPHPEHSFGRDYGQHRAYLEFTVDQHKRLKDECDKLGVVYSCSAWDKRSARELIALGAEIIKIPSARNDDSRVCLTLRDEFPGQIHISLGMLTPREIDLQLRWWEGDPRVVWYACTSGYPIRPEEAYLYELTRLPEPKGWSSHTPGTNIEIAAYALGAEWIEKHFTLNRRWRGTDQANSLDAAGMLSLVSSLDEVHEALRMKPADLSPTEREQKEKLKR